MLLVLAGLGGFVAAPPVAAAAHDYRQAVYAYGVAQFCGFAGPEVGAGFRIEALYLIQRDALSATQAQAARAAAARALRLEWRYRGRGRMDPRCRTEGRVAARRLRAFLHAAGP